MHSILIVDDEVDIRKAIIDIIEWEKLGFLLAGEAGNGQEALDLMEDTAPDVILTDIKMPFMDGITLAEKVRELHPVTKIVFLTGFNDFDYAISAIKLNVIAYLLKPISAQSLSETLLSIREKLEEEERSIRDMERLREGYGQSLELRKMSFLISLVSEHTGPEPADRLPDRLIEEYGLQLLGERFLLFAVSLDASSFAASTVPTDDLELLKFSVARTVRSIAQKYVEGEVFIFGSVVIGILSDTAENLGRYGDILIREVHQTIPLYYGFTATIGVGESYGAARESGAAFRAALSAIRYRVYLGENRVIYLSDVEKGGEFVSAFDEAREIRLSSLIKTGGEDEALALVAEVFDALEAGGAGPESFRVNIIEMYAAILRALRSVVGGMDADTREEFLYQEDIFARKPPAQREWVGELCRRAVARVQQQQRTSSGIIAEKALEYIRSHYEDPALSLKAVSQALHISSSYLSAVFKKQTGQSFTAALIGIRMETARELLLASRLKVFEIAAKTGYADQHYFSYCFKKHFGQSPGELRAAHAAAQAE